MMTNREQGRGGAVADDSFFTKVLDQYIRPPLRIVSEIKRFFLNFGGFF
jgi:hypothetical protein